MFRFEIEMIPILMDSLSNQYDIKYFAQEFNTGNGVADLVYSKKVNKETFLFNDYRQTSLYVNFLQNKRKIKKSLLLSSCDDKSNLNKLLNSLEHFGYYTQQDDFLIKRKSFKPQVEKLISIEAKLKDWKSGFLQALRYQFYSHQSFLAYPVKNIHRVDQTLLLKHNIGLISVGNDNIEILINPKEKKPVDLISYYFLSENFAKKIIK